jgi:hypothetical protein
MKVTEAVGTIKNIQARGTTSQVITANFSERNDEGKCIATMPLVFVGEAKNLVEGIANEAKVSITGRVVTRFDRRPGIDNAQRFKPFTQVEVTSLILAQ